ncbi:MAG TPA: amidohydrolase family protein, partial [Kofleriaceae bacterium]|nr:amidohydrolase family protein [Kofleriaceae bacterium]
MAFGLSLEEVVLRSTYTPAKALRLTHKAGSLKVGRAADITVMVLREGTFKFRDNPYAFGTPEYMESNRLLSPVITLLDGQVYPCNPAFLPDLGNLQVQEDVWTWMGQRPQRSTEYRLAGEE